MKKQQLRDCFDKVKPREELVRTTLDRMHAARQGEPQTSRRTLNYGFVTRLATAACALVLLVGVGISLGRGAITASDPSPLQDERVSPATTDASGEPFGIHPSSARIGAAERILARAREQGGEWAVAEVDVEAMYFLELTDEQRAEGILQRCAVVLRTITIAQTNALEEHALPDGDSEEAFVAQICFTNAEDVAHMMDAIGSSVLVRLHVAESNGEAVWRIEEFYPEDVPME